MANLRNVIKDIVAGDSFNIVRTITNIDTGDRLIKAWFTVKKDRLDADNDAVIQNEITTVESNDGQILDDGSATNIATISFALASADTDLLEQGVEYVYDIRYLTHNGEVTTPELGLLYAKDSITQATS